MISTADLADKYTILLLKQEHGVPVYEDLELYRRIMELRNIDIQELMEVNRRMWNLEDSITAEKDHAKIGVCYVALRRMTKERMAAKNKIAVRCREPIEEKNY